MEALAPVPLLNGGKDMAGGGGRDFGTTSPGMPAWSLLRVLSGIG